MRILILILSLAFAITASAQADRYNLGVHEDGTYCEETGVVEVYPPEAVLVDGEIRYTDANKDIHVLECKGGAVSLEPVKWRKLPEPRRFVIPVDWAQGADGDPDPRKKPLPPKDTPVGLIATGAAATLAALGGGAAVLRGRGKA